MQNYKLIEGIPWQLMDALCLLLSLLLLLPLHALLLPLLNYYFGTGGTSFVVPSSSSNKDSFMHSVGKCAHIRLHIYLHNGLHLTCHIERKTDRETKREIARANRKCNVHIAAQVIHHLSRVWAGAVPKTNRNSPVSSAPNFNVKI